MEFDSERLECRAMLTYYVDTGFGVEGYTDATFARDSIDLPSSIAVQNDGKIVVAGHTQLNSWDFGVVRFNANGSLDNTFDNDGNFDRDGIQSTDIYRESFEIAGDLAIQPDGKIVVVGTTLFQNRPSYDFAVVRYNANGNLDTTFDNDGQFGSNDGIQTTDIFNGSSDWARGVALQSDGKIVVVGTTFIDDDWDIAVVRYNYDGTLDETFDDDGLSFDLDGIQTTDIFDGSEDYAVAVAIQSDGKIVVAGTVDLYGGDEFDLALLRYNPNGTLDTTFDVRGLYDHDGIVTDSFGETLKVRDLAIQDDGKIVVFGSVYADSTDSLLVVRYLPNGDLDRDFGTHGYATVSVPGASELYAGGMVIQRDGKIVVTGEADNGSVVTRLLPDGTLDLTAGTRKFSGDSLGLDVAMTNDGKLLLVGPSNYDGGADFTVLRVAEDVSTTPNNVSFSSNSRGDLRVYGSQESDEIILGVRDGNVTVNGTDTGIANGSIRNLFVFGKGGDDLIQIANIEMQGNLRVMGANGDDTVALTGIDVHGSTRVAAGAGNDRTWLGRELLPGSVNTFRGTFVLSLGAGDDSLYHSSAGTSYRSRTLLSGDGGGRDVFTSEGNSNSALIRGFESTLYYGGF
jgi:uncharacterized delta-60 repeat protein